jgi:hypothetical protein
MATNGFGPRTRRQIESDLIEVVRKRQREWLTAGEADRELTRHRFMESLQVFEDLAFFGKFPGRT